MSEEELSELEITEAERLEKERKERERKSKELFSEYNQLFEKNRELANSCYARAVKEKKVHGEKAMELAIKYFKEEEKCMQKTNLS